MSQVPNQPANPLVNVYNPAGIDPNAALETLFKVGEGKRQRGFEGQQREADRQMQAQLEGQKLQQEGQLKREEFGLEHERLTGAAQQAELDRQHAAQLQQQRLDHERAMAEKEAKRLRDLQNFEDRMVESRTRAQLARENIERLRREATEGVNVDEAANLAPILKDYDDQITKSEGDLINLSALRALEQGTKADALVEVYKLAENIQSSKAKLVKGMGTEFSHAIGRLFVEDSTPPSTFYRHHPALQLVPGAVADTLYGPLQGPAQTDELLQKVLAEVSDTFLGTQDNNRLAARVMKGYISALAYEDATPEYLNQIKENMTKAIGEYKLNPMLVGALFDSLEAATKGQLEEWEKKNRSTTGLEGEPQKPVLTPGSEYEAKFKRYSKLAKNVSLARKRALDMGLPGVEDTARYQQDWTKHMAEVLQAGVVGGFVSPEEAQAAITSWLEVRGDEEMIAEVTAKVQAATEAANRKIREAALSRGVLDSGGLQKKIDDLFSNTTELRRKRQAAQDRSALSIKRRKEELNAEYDRREKEEWERGEAEREARRKALSQE